MPDQRGFIFSGLSLLLIFTVMLLLSAFLASLKGGSEASSVRIGGRKVAFAAEDAEYNVSKLAAMGFLIDNSLLRDLALVYYQYGGVPVRAWIIENFAYIFASKSWGLENAQCSKAVNIGAP
jgi:hypothetical protein